MVHLSPRQFCSFRLRAGAVKLARGNRPSHARRTITDVCGPRLTRARATFLPEERVAWSGPARPSKCRRSMLDLAEGKLGTQILPLPCVAQGAAECSGAAAESIGLVDAPITDIAACRNPTSHP